MNKSEVIKKIFGDQDFITVRFVDDLDGHFEHYECSKSDFDGFSYKENSGSDNLDCDSTYHKFSYNGMTYTFVDYQKDLNFV